MTVLLNIPADANTIQAWVSVVQLLFTIVAGVLLYCTFRLQANTFVEQQRLTNIEQHRFKLQMRPDLNIVRDYNKVILTSINNSLWKFSLSVNVIYPEIQFHKSDLVALADVPFISLDSPLEIEYEIRGFVKSDAELFEFIITYEDEIGNKYLVIATFYESGEIFKTGPEEMKKRPFL